MKKFIIFAALLGFAVSASAAKVAVVDSGTDFRHALLKGKEAHNAKEIAGNRVDDDRNGKVDDIFGWNFIDSFNQVFYPAHISRVNPITYKLLEVVAHMQAGIASDSEKTYWEQYVVKLTDPQKQLLGKHLNFYGQYAHGTHVAGIVVEQNPKAGIVAARVFPDEVLEEYAHPLENKDGIFGWATKYLYRLIGYFQSMIFHQVAEYHAEQGVDVANYSLGVPLKMIAKGVLAAQGIKDPTPEQLSRETVKAFKEFEARGLAWMKASPNTLFVVASGNDGSDNDLYPIFPANLRLSHSITVGAVHDSGALAKFSNYGRNTVDVFAPGVAIMSAVPSKDNTMTLPMSGTSMAAPFVAGVASRVKDINPNLSAWMVREILMGTVDYKDHLTDKSVSGGIVNPERAYAAAELSKVRKLEEAIASARVTVSDLNRDKQRFETGVADKSRFPELSRLADQLVF